MVDNAPILSCQHAGLTIEGYSRAAVQSYWRIPELKIGFDLGAQPWDFMGTPTWLITHTHLDHIAALPVYVARRRMMRMEPPDVYVPAYAVEDVRRFLLILQRLDRGRMVCNLHGVNAGEEIELSRDHVIVPFATTHTIPSVGYVVWERRFKLKEEYHGLPGDKIRDLRLSGVAVTREVRTPLVAYTGDTSPGGLDAYPPVYRGENPDHGDEFRAAQPSPREDPQVRPHAPGRLHRASRPVQERADHLRHFSTRYHPQEVRRIVEAKMPPRLLERVKLWL